MFADHLPVFRYTEQSIGLAPNRIRRVKLSAINMAFQCSMPLNSLEVLYINIQFPTKIQRPLNKHKFFMCPKPKGVFCGAKETSGALPTRA